MTTASSPEQHAVYWPRGARRMRSKQPAPRLETLNGKTVAQLWDYMFRGDEVFAVLEAAIRKRYPDVRFVSWREFGNTHGSEEHEVLAALPQRFRELGVDAAISAMGC